jgi:hypothetical protein
VDAAGEAYITGITNSGRFPILRALQPKYAGQTSDALNGDAFLVKLAADGKSLKFSTFIGGSRDDWGNGIAVDSRGNAYVTGETDSADFPTLHAFQARFVGGRCVSLDGPYPCADAFVAAVNVTGQLRYSSFIAGDSVDTGTSVAVDGPGNAYIVGNTDSTDFPTADPFQETKGGGDSHESNAFVMKVSPGGL